MRSFHTDRFRGALAAAAVLLISGCFYSDAPLLTAAEIVQPIRTGMWESLVPVDEIDWSKMPAADKTTNHCRTIGKSHFCAERLRITSLPDRTYRLEWQDEAEKETVQMAKLTRNSFIVQQVADDRSAEYTLLTKASSDEFAVSLPKCDQDTYLRVYAPPSKAGSTRCRVADRGQLYKLFAAYLAKSRAKDARVYRRVGD